MVTSQNLEDLRGNGHGYIVGRNRRRSGEVFDYIQSATGPWIECPVGITAREKATPPKTLVQEVVAQKPGVRVFVVHSSIMGLRTARRRAMDACGDRGSVAGAPLGKGVLGCACQLALADHGFWRSTSGGRKGRGHSRKSRGSGLGDRVHAGERWTRTHLAHSRRSGGETSSRPWRPIALLSIASMRARAAKGYLCIQPAQSHRLRQRTLRIAHRFNRDFPPSLLKN
jgi:hypothetical protein